MFRDLLLALLFGILEGITEWLPVSSTGHLILLRELLPYQLDNAFFSLFEVVIQLGAIAAVPLLFFRTLFPFSRERLPSERRAGLALWGKIALATVPAAVCGFFLDDLLEKWLFNPLTVAIALIFYGIAFLVVEAIQKRRAACPIADVSCGQALGIGAFQTLALIPGTSRSGATILGATILGVPRSAATAFSFFLAIPTMAGAGLLKAAKFFTGGGTLTPSEWLLLAVGTLTAFLTSLTVIRFLMDFVRRRGFTVFAVWRILLGGAVLLTLFF